MESILKAAGLKKYYGSGDTQVRALDGVDLEIERGKFTAIIGTSGSGKSTLLNILGGLDVPTEGSVRIGGTELSGLDREQAALRQKGGWANLPVDSPTKTEGEIIKEHVFTFFNLIFVPFCS